MDGRRRYKLVSIKCATVALQKKRQNVSVGQTHDSIRIRCKSTLVFIIPSTAVVIWSVIKA